MSKPTYEYLEAQVKQLEADNEKAMSVLKEANNAVLLAKSKFEALAAENAGLKEAIDHTIGWVESTNGDLCDVALLKDVETPATDSFLAEVQSKAREEGAYFVANRMLAAWDAGFIDDTAKNAADIARMILTSAEFMADAPEGDFDRSFADGVLKDIAAQLRKGAAQ